MARKPGSAFAVSSVVVALILAGCGGGGRSATTGHFGVVGPTGPEGPTDAGGITGPSGASGPTGPSGPSGVIGPSGASGPKTSVISPIAFTASNLKKESEFLGTPFYWAGPRQGYVYEFTRSARGLLFVRYLPKGTPVGTPGTDFLVVATYPDVGAFDALKQAAHGEAVAGPGGSIYVVRPNRPKNVLLAFPGVDYQIEIYDPVPADAARIASSGLVQPVTG